MKNALKKESLLKNLKLPKEYSCKVEADVGDFRKILTRFFIYA